MKKISYALLLGSVCLSAGLPVSAAHADTLPLRRVVISASGLALYEHQGTVRGDQDIALPVRVDRVDDMLKSLVVLDGRGSLGGITLPGREPLSQTFRDLPFQQEDLDNIVQLLGTLRGADIRVDDIQGRLMNVGEETEESENGLIVRHRISVLTPAGIKTAILERAGTMQFTDEAVQAQIDRALAALYTNRIRDQRSLTVSLRGNGERTVGLAYIQDAPLWKSTYRLVLPPSAGKDAAGKDTATGNGAEADGKAVFQGWAVLENTTGQDWDDVRVSLISGAPVTYHQALYESYHVPRPELPVKVMDRVLPRADRGVIEARDVAEAADMPYFGGESAAVMNKAAARGRSTMAAPADMAGGYAAMESMALAAAPPAPAAYAQAGMPPAMAAMTAASAAETAGQMTFAFPQPVDLPAGHTLMLPFVSGSLPAERLWVYQPETNESHPLAALSLKNDTDGGMPPGILTIYDKGEGGFLHVGDADMPMIPKGDERFISFALDTKTNIRRETQEDRALGIITINKGVLRQKVSWRNTTTYTMRAPQDEARSIVIEHPRRGGWELVRPEGIEGDPVATDSHYRLRLDIKAGESKKLAVTVYRDDVEAVALSGIAPANLETRMAAAGKDMPAPLRKALAKVKGMQESIHELRQKITQGEQERQRIYADQERLRQNVQAVSADTAIGKRYLASLEKQETQLDAIQAAQEGTRIQLQAEEKALRDYISGLEF